MEDRMILDAFREVVKGLNDLLAQTKSEPQPPEQEKPLAFDPYAITDHYEAIRAFIMDAFWAHEIDGPACRALMDRLDTRRGHRVSYDR